MDRQCKLNLTGRKILAAMTVRRKAAKWKAFCCSEKPNNSRDKPAGGEGENWLDYWVAAKTALGLFIECDILGSQPSLDQFLHTGGFERVPFLALAVMI